MSIQLIEQYDSMVEQVIRPGKVLKDALRQD